MKLVILSDTHMRHQDLPPLRGDVLIFCGDFYEDIEDNDYRLQELRMWFAQQEFDLKIFVGGNHDLPVYDRREKLPGYFKNIVYLEDEAYCFNGLTFYGSPWTPDVEGWAYYGDEDFLKEKWQKIPEKVDVLITHTPPEGILDTMTSGEEVGCPWLAERVNAVQPRIHCFGHVHASYGSCIRGGTRFINAALITGQGPLRMPIEIEIQG